ECEPVPGRTLPSLTVVERDYGAVADQWAALGPLAEQLGAVVKSASWIPDAEVEQLAARNGRVRGGAADGRPALERPEHAAEAMLALSGVTNGRLAAAGLPAADRPPADAGRRPAARQRGRAGGHAALSDAALEVVDPLGVPGQPAHAHAVPRRLRAVDEPAGRRGDRRARQRLDRGAQ